MSVPQRCLDCLMSQRRLRRLKAPLPYGAESEAEALEEKTRHTDTAIAKKLFTKLRVQKITKMYDFSFVILDVGVFF